MLARPVCISSGLAGLWTISRFSCRRHRMLSSLMLCCALLGSDPITAPELTGAEENLVDCVNAARQQNGLHPLAVDMRLMEGTRRHAYRMASRCSLHHASGCIENIAMGQDTSREACRTWLNSPPHRANMLSRGVTRLAVTGYRSAINGRIYWCLRVAR